ncbi:MAG: NUDIX hydrolase [Phycisphaerales bacterium JB039]
MAKEIELIARGLLLRGGDVLLCRNIEQGHLFLPGGHIEFGEPAADALAREFAEESDLAVRVGPLLLVTEGSFEQKGKRHHEINLVFHVEPTAGPAPEHVASREPQITFDWTPLAAVQERDVRPQAIQAWLAAGGRGDPAGAGWLSDMH